jgi:hypothetical protein
MGWEESVYRDLVGILEGKRPLGRPRLIFRKWDVGDTESVELAKDRESWQALVNAVINLQVP